MRKLLLPVVVALGVSVIGLPGCGIVYKQPIYQGNLLEKSAVDQLQPGMGKQQVLALLGTPSIADPFHDQRWDYTASARTGRTARTHEIKNLTVYFENDALVRWEGEYFPEQDKELAREVRSAFGANLAKEKKGRGR